MSTSLARTADGWWVVTPAGLVRLGLPNPEFAADLWLLTHPDLRHSPRVRVFLDFMAGEVAKRRKFIEGAETGPNPATRNLNDGTSP